MAMSNLVLSVMGSDRPGLTQALAGAVLGADGNWLESHLSQLGGLYVGSVLIEIDPDRVEALRSAAAGVDAQGLEVRIAPAQTSAPGGGADIRFSLVGQDRPGIVHQVTAALGDLGVNIETFTTRLSAEPYSGVPLFNLEAELRLPPGLESDAVQAALEAISTEVMVDIISITPQG